MSRAIFIIVAMGLALRAHGAADLLVRGATVWTGTGSPVLENTDIEIKAGKITRIGTALKSRVRPILEARGHFVMPGLIDSHTHLRSVPGSVYRGDSEESLSESRKNLTRAYLAAGVTTVLDCAAPASLLIENQTRTDDDARVLGLAPFITPDGGYFAGPSQRGETYKDLWAPVREEADFIRLFESAARYRPVGAKVTMESGFGPFDVWPLLTPSMRVALAREAASRGVPLFVHSMTENEHRLALTLKPHALVHAGFAESNPSPAILKELKDSGVYVITTAAILKSILLMFQEERLQEPWLRRLVPEAQLKTALDRSLRHRIAVQSVLEGTPWWIPDFLARLSAPLIFSESMMKRNLSIMQKSLKMMYDAGIPLVMGSDAGNWPVWTTFFHGAGSLLEMEALEEAGIPREELLIAATSRPAKMLKIDHLTGTIETGKAGDLLILKSDPRLGFTALKDPAWIVRAGLARDSAGWLGK